MYMYTRERYLDGAKLEKVQPDRLPAYKSTQKTVDYLPTGFSLGLRRGDYRHAGFRSPIATKDSGLQDQSRESKFRGSGKQVRFSEPEKVCKAPDYSTQDTLGRYRQGFRQGYKVETPGPILPAALVMPKLRRKFEPLEEDEEFDSSYKEAEATTMEARYGTQEKLSAAQADDPEVVRVTFDQTQINPGLHGANDAEAGKYAGRDGVKRDGAKPAVV